MMKVFTAAEMYIVMATAAQLHKINCLVAYERHWSY